jgi:hypothetical protein
MPWKGHNPLTPSSSSAPLDTSNHYELTHIHLGHLLLHATTKVSFIISKKVKGNCFSNKESVIATFSRILAMSERFPNLHTNP